MDEMKKLENGEETRFAYMLHIFQLLLYVKKN